MRTVKIERERWNTPHNTIGVACVLINLFGCGCIMGLIGEACGLTSDVLLNHGSLSLDSLTRIGLSEEVQERAIEINDDSAISDERREAKLKELFKDHLILEFV
jgi:hypothetical protein